MISSPDRIDELFWDALQLPSEEARRAYLDRACGTDHELRQLLEKLLRAQPRAATFLEQPLTTTQPTVDETITECPGTVIGPYKLLEQIDEGGMGLVFMAEQQQPIRRKVALKLIKPGMDTRQVIARFEAERQALALMDHLNIAKVLDAGQTSGGRPYFVMELVKGLPINEFCDQAKLPIRERLELFRSVCQAVQHAHQKGIIHRDIKPSNVLVTLHDGAPLAKVIDFGIAKALGQELTDKTLYTGIAQLIGTPLYMSPEQAAFSNVDVDTRSDIYSLGVLLYELLTGTTPFDKERLHEAGYDEMRRIIREEEPPKPSTRLSQLRIADCGSWISGKTGLFRSLNPQSAIRNPQSAIARAGLDRDEVPREGSQPPLRDGQRSGPGHSALPERRAGAGVPAVGVVSLPKVRRQEPQTACHGGRFCGAARCRGHPRLAGCMEE
jgi:serine/threonine-protein kinase